MTSNLLIGTAQYTVDATANTSSSAADSSYPISNVITGPRGTYTQLATAATSSWIKWDLGASTALSIDFYYVARAKLLKSAGSKRLLLDGSTDDASYTNICGAASTFQSITLYGPRSEDALFTSELANSASGTLSATPTYRYLRHWAAGEGTEPSKKWKHSKVMFGSWFDPGRDPERPHQIEKISRTPADRESVYTFTFTWRGITNAKRNEFITKLFSERQKPVILYTRSYHDLLLEHRVVHCMVSDWSTYLLAPDCHEITVTFEEMI